MCNDSEKFKDYRIIEGKPKWVIVDKNGNIINRNPNIDLKILERLEKIRPKKYSDEELLDKLIEFVEDNGRPPKQTDFSNFSTYQIHFGSWSNALKKAGLLLNRFINTNEELLNYLIEFYEENGKPPSYKNFTMNPKYPGSKTYVTRFGSWQNALKLAGLDVDSIVKKGVVRTNNQKARLFELLVKEHFEKEIKDLAGDYCKSPYDGICPKGQTYDTKSSKLYEDKYWKFSLLNLYREDIEWFYLGAFNCDYSKLLHVWRIPGDFINENSLYIGIDSGMINVDNMKEYEIINKFKGKDKYASFIEYKS